MAKMKEYSKAYNKEAIEFALCEIELFPCKTCGHPVRDGYCCGHCGEIDPSEEYQEMSDVSEMMIR